MMPYAPSRSAVRWPLTAGDCSGYYLLATAALLRASPDTLANTWNIKKSAIGPASLSPLTGTTVDRVVSRLTGVPQEVISADQIHTLAGTSFLPWALDRPITVRDRIRTAVPAVCLHCLADRPWAVRTSWRIPILPICQHHLVTLVISCPSCGHPLRAASPIGGIATSTLPACGMCGQRFADMATTAHQRGSDADVVRASERVAAALKGIRARESGTEDLDLAAVHDLAHLLALAMTHDEARPRRRMRKGIYELSPAAIAQVLPQAVRMADPSTDLEALARQRPLAHVSRDALTNVVRGKRGALRPVVLAHVLREQAARRSGQATRLLPAWASHSPQAWPRHTPNSVFTLELADVLHDLISHAEPSALDLDTARAVAACLVLSHSCRISALDAATALRHPGRIGDLAQRMTQAAQQTGREDHLAHAVARAAILTDRCSGLTPGRSAESARGSSEWLEVSSANPDEEAAVREGGVPASGNGSTAWGAA